MRSPRGFRRTKGADVPDGRADQGGMGGHPPAVNVLALATFSASLSGRALDPVLPHVADDFGITIATAAGFAAVFAFTFAAIQPLIGAAADLFGKARLMIFCLVILGLANIVGAFATSFPLLFV